MSTGNIKLILLAVVGLLCLMASCETAQAPRSAVNSAMADSLISVVDRATTAVTDRRYPDFLKLVDPIERGQLERIVSQYGYSSLKAYLDQQMHGWPNTDTLVLADLVSDSTHARITFTGNGNKLGQKPTIRYTIVMLRLTSEGWRLAAMTSIEKDAEDMYGNQMTYHETELPTKLRFPRPI